MSTITQLFNPSIGEYGQDYAVPVGTPIYSPVSGVVGTEDNGKTAWGKRAFVHASTGLSFAVGHLTRFAVSAGQHVNAGDLIGYSGGAASDPSSGVSTGPHVETQFINESGKYLDPRTVFAQFSSWEQAIFNPSASAAPATGSGDLLSSLNPLSGVGQAIGAATTSIEQLAMRATVIVIGVVVLIIGIVLIVFGDVEKILEAGQGAAEKVAEKAAPAAALAAA